MCYSSAAGAASGAFFLAQRAWTAFRAAALRSSAVSPAQRAFPPCDWIALKVLPQRQLFALRHVWISTKQRHVQIYSDFRCNFQGWSSCRASLAVFKTMWHSVLNSAFQYIDAPSERIERGLHIGDMKAPRTVRQRRRTMPMETEEIRSNVMRLMGWVEKQK